MTTQEQIGALESRLLELGALMRSKDYINNKISDAYYLHGATAATQVAENYREDLEAREGWRDEYNQVEAQIVALRTQLTAEQAEVEQTAVAEEVNDVG